MTGKYYRAMTDARTTRSRTLARRREQRAWRAYLRASRLLEAALDRDLQYHGVQLSEYEIISMLSEAPDRRLRMSGLADLVVQSRSRLTHTAGRLEKRGWVQREPCCRTTGAGSSCVLTDDGARGGHRDGPRARRQRPRAPSRPPEPRRSSWPLGEAMDAIARRHRRRAATADEAARAPSAATA